MARSRYIAIAASLVLVSVALIYWWWSGDRRQDGYVTEPVSRGAIAAVVSATGTLNPVKSVQVGTYMSGPIKQLYADFNSAVKEGQLVAKIDPRPFQVKVLEAEANLANARARVDKDRADLEFKKLTLGRNREIGIRMAVGAKSRHILLQFLVEAVTLSMVGGLAGAILGIVGAQLISYLAAWPTVLSPPAVAGSFLFSGAVGVFFGFYPARKASRLDPIAALRYE